MSSGCRGRAGRVAQFADDAGPWRFNELETRLSIPPNTLTWRLKEFEAFELLTRETRETVPPHVVYTATPKAIELQAVLQYLTLWSMRSKNQPAASKTKDTNEQKSGKAAVSEVSSSSDHTRLPDTD
ncbi:winged helix-turn-helix transcriptional regulator [Halocatena salina]|uniref:winged helix-turn-helix transcriptional regulator n=1 Tax=Halocatena salina TaxID=2934340 RepID=UPI0034A10B3A